MERGLWHVTYGEPVVMFSSGLGRPLTRWERLRWRIKEPFLRLRYVVEDISEVSLYRIEGAWRVLLGRSDWR